MSGLAARPATAGLSAARPAAAAARVDAGRASALRLAAFAALGLFGAGHWASFVESRSGGRTLLVVLVASAGGGLLILLGLPAVRTWSTGVLGGRPRAAAALIVAVGLVCGFATIVLGLAAAGLPIRLLGWSNWAELFDGLDRGFAGVQTVDWPYNGADEWVRLTVLLGAPLLLGIAATLAFLPVPRGRSAMRAAALVVLLVLYAVPATEHDPGQPLLRGLVLLALVAAWLWLPRLAAREAAAGAGLVLGLGLLSLPIAAALDADQRWWDYGPLDWFGAGKVVTFDWTHRYGPLDWPREGTTLLNVRSDRPLYWKAETLDSFDGLRWARGQTSDASQDLQGLPLRRMPQGRTWDYFEWNPRWDEELRFTVRALTSDLVIAAGTPYREEGVGFATTAGDGTIHTAEGPLTKGDSYTVQTYAPSPTVKQMRGAPTDLPGTLLPYTTIELPGAGENGLYTNRASLGGEEVVVPLWGSTHYGDPTAPRRALERSAYARMYRVATSVTAGAPTMYAAVDRIEHYLDRNYSYDEKTPRAKYPLNAFLFRDKFGYCQQFSGAMALMLRMVGVPARVAAGFAPGSYNRDTGEYRVRDLDAHSWVEVYFNGIGWVTFDPTPAASPAETQDADLIPTSDTGGAINGSRAGVAAHDRAPGGPGSPGGGSGSGVSPWLILPLVALAAAGLIALRLVRRTRRLTSAQLAEAQLVELRRALARLGWQLPAATTLLALERRLDRTAGPASARYAAGLRAHRYDPQSPEGPSLRERREMRRELTARSGPVGRLRGLLAIPPGGPRPA